jgi:hypothetical protein
MTFWLYQPKQLFKSSTLLPYKSKDVGDFLNFLTIFLFSFTLYIQKKIPGEIWKKILVCGLFFIILVSLFSESKDETDFIEGIEIPKYSDYQFTLSVD